MSGSILIKIILIPAVHFLFSILFVGAGLLALLKNKTGLKTSACPGSLLVAVSLGILYNTLQFGLVLAIYRILPLQAQALLGIGKYAVDLAFLLSVLLFFRKKFFDLLKQMLTAFYIPANAVLLLLAMLLGFLAIINFPHVHDSGQLIATNRMLLQGANFLTAKRFGLGFSALCYFPAAVFRSVPMGTLAAGFKLFLLLLTGLIVIYGVDKLGTVHSAVNKFLYFFIFMGSVLGLYGIMELGKDSAWAVLFSMLFIFSLFKRESSAGAFESLAYFFCAAALGMIVVPFLSIFLALILALRFLPRSLIDQKMLLPAAVILLLLLGVMLMPLKLTLCTPHNLESLLGKYSCWAPTNGKISFFRYFVTWQMLDFANSPLVIIAGLTGILFLPWLRKYFQDLAIRSTALFLPAVTSVFLLLAYWARNFIPGSRSDRIPLTPFSTFDAWNLIKDIPQWYVQIVSGIFFIILLESLASKVLTRTKTRRAIYCGFALISAMAVASANFPHLAALAKPAHFFSYGGNKNKYLASVLESIHSHPQVKTVILARRISAFNPGRFFNDARHYFVFKRIEVNWKLDPAGLSALGKWQPALLIIKKAVFLELLDQAKEKCRLHIDELAFFREINEGIYLIQSKKRKQLRTFLPGSL